MDNVKGIRSANLASQQANLGQDLPESGGHLLPLQDSVYDTVNHYPELHTMSSTAPLRPHFLTFPEVEKLTGLSRSKIYRQIKRGDFPKPRLISLRKVAFVQIELDNWFEQRQPA